MGSWSGNLLLLCLHYLKASGLHLCLLLNFGKPRLEIKRLVLTQ
jgi:hypothetical protein